MLHQRDVLLYSCKSRTQRLSEISLVRLNGEICEYCTNVQLLGADWVFVCRQFWPQSTAESGQENFGQEPANFQKNDFFVDAGLKILW